jgi:excisionase family DNA binding protein
LEGGTVSAPKITLYTIAEAADIIGVGKTTLYRAHWAGKLPHRVLPGTSMVRLTREDIDEYLADGYRPAAA